MHHHHDLACKLVSVLLTMCEPRLDGVSRLLAAQHIEPKSESQCLVDAPKLLPLIFPLSNAVQEGDEDG